MTLEESNRIWILKAFSVVAIVACHCVHVSENACKLNRGISIFFNYWMGMGVPVFYFLAGYLFHRSEKISVFIAKKVRTLVIPWIFTGTLVWLYIVLRKGGVSLSGWLDFVVFKKSYLHFMTNLILYYLVYYCMLSRKSVLSIFLALQIVNNIVPLDVFHWMSRYLNLYFLFIFGTGIFLQDSKFFDILSKGKIELYMIAFIVLQTLELCQIKLYIVGLGITVFLWIAILTCAIPYLNKSKRLKDMLVQLGKNSFPIYLLHMPAAGLIANILNRSEFFAFLTILRPVFVIIITMIMIRIYIKLTRRNLKCAMLIGCR